MEMTALAACAVQSWAGCLVVMVAATAVPATAAVLLRTTRAMPFQTAKASAWAERMMAATEAAMMVVRPSASSSESPEAISRGNATVAVNLAGARQGPSLEAMLGAILANWTLVPGPLPVAGEGRQFAGPSQSALR